MKHRAFPLAGSPKHGTLGSRNQAVKVAVPLINTIPSFPLEESLLPLLSLNLKVLIHARLVLPPRGKVRVS